MSWYRFFIPVFLCSCTVLSGNPNTQRTIVESSISGLKEQLEGLPKFKNKNISQLFNNLSVNYIGIYVSDNLISINEKHFESFYKAIITPRYIKGYYESNTNLIFNKFVKDTFHYVNLLTENVEIYALEYYCQEGKNVNGDQFIVFHFSIDTSLIINNKDHVSSEMLFNNWRNASNQKELVMKPFRIANEMKKRELWYLAVVSYKNFIDVYQKRPKYAKWGAFNEPDYNFNFDTAGIQDSINMCYEKIKTTYSDSLTKINLLDSISNEAFIRRQDILKNALIIKGNVTNVNGNEITIYGRAIPFKNAGTDGGLWGMYIAELGNAIYSRLGGSNDDEDIPGAVSNNDVNIIIEGYEKDQKIQGSASEGSLLTAGPYVFVKQGVGETAMGGSVYVKYYKPLEGYKETLELQNKIDQLIKDRRKVYSNLLLKEMSNLSKDENAFFERINNSYQ